MEVGDEREAKDGEGWRVEAGREEAADEAKQEGAAGGHDAQER